jgi:acyl dehydratase
MMLTDEVRSWLGRTASYRASEPLGQASIRYFALATGDDPDRWDGVAPPTLICETCQIYGGLARHAVTGYLGHSWELPFAVPTRLVRGGNDYTFLRPVTAGDLIGVTWTLVDLVEKASFVVAVAEAVYSNQFGVRLAVNRETSLHQPVPSGQSGSDATGGPGKRAAPWDLSTPPTGELPQPKDLVMPLDAADLMAYGAATWDWHRLHYDAIYCRSIGLDGPIVDGQLLGALQARHVRDWAGPHGALHRLWFRNTAVVRPGDEVRVEGRVVRTAGPLVELEQRACVNGQLVAVGGAELVVRVG